MTEWVWEAGIGEDRAALITGGRIVAARIRRHDAGPCPGAVLPARLTEIVRKGALGRVALGPSKGFGGGEAMLAPIPAGLTLGAALTVMVTREAIPERGRPKLAMVAATDAAPAAAPALADELAASGHPVRKLRAHEADALEEAGWTELLEEASGGEIAFPGGALRMSVTPAMTLFDVDGDAAPDTLALAGAGAAAAAIGRFDIGGNIGIDLPTVTGKGARQAVDAALADALPTPFEKTAINGFGFVQVVRPRPRASLPEWLAADPALAGALALLRRLERDPQPAVTVPRSVLAALAARPDWTAELARRTGRPTEFGSR